MLLVVSPQLCLVILHCHTCGLFVLWSARQVKQRRIWSKLPAWSRISSWFPVYVVLSNPFLPLLFDTLNLICVEDAFSFINRNPYVYSRSVPRSPLEACMWLVTSLDLEGQEWGCWHRDCACFQRLPRQSCSFGLFHKDITKWCPCIFHFTCVDQYVEGLLPFL